MPGPACCRRKPGDPTVGRTQCWGLAAWQRMTGAPEGPKWGLEARSGFPEDPSGCRGWRTDGGDSKKAGTVPRDEGRVAGREGGQAGT